MEFEQFIVYTILALLGIIIVFGVWNLIYNFKIIKRFSGKYVKILANYELQSEDLSSLFTVTYFNNNMSDIKVHSFGFLYCNEQVDFYEEYVKQHTPEVTKRMVIEPTDSVKLQVPYDRMKKMLLTIRNNRNSVLKVYGYIVDSNGNQTTIALKDIRKNVKRIFKDELNKEKKDRKETIRKAKMARKSEKANQKRERKEERLKRRTKRRENRKERWGFRKKRFTEFLHLIGKKISSFFRKIKNKFKRKNESE